MLEQFEKNNILYLINVYTSDIVVITRLTVRVGFSPKSKTRPESYTYLGQVLTQYS